MNQPLRPTDAHGARFTTPAPLKIISWLQDTGFELVLDTPEMVELAYDQQVISITAAGVVTTRGSDAARAARMLLLNSEEH